jgi:hypothetical protein
MPAKVGMHTLLPLPSILTITPFAKFLVCDILADAPADIALAEILGDCVRSLFRHLIPRRFRIDEPVMVLHLRATAIPTHLPAVPQRIANACCIQALVGTRDGEIHIRYRSSSKPASSLCQFPCGNKPSFRSVMNAASNSNPLAKCTVINCNASSPAWT